MEVWKDIEGYEGYYQVSNLGRVRSLGRVVVYSRGKLEVKGRVLANAKDRNGYPVVCLHKDGKQKTIKVHRLVLSSFNPNEDKDRDMVNHINGIKTDNTLENLEWCNGSENMYHAVDTGLFIAAKGQNHGLSKLTEDQVREIKYGLKGLLQKEIALKFNVTAAAISSIRTGKNWSWL